MADNKYPDWFSITAKPNFERFLTPLAGKDNLNFLQLGAYTGDASLWMLDNVLTGKNCILFDVDTWEGSDEEVHHKMDFSDVERVYDEKINKRSFKQKTTSLEYLLTNTRTYDFVYVDADHTAASAFLDGELGWQRLNSGGILAFDDYEWGTHLPAHLAPKLGVQLFIHRHQAEFETLVINGQYWVRKI